MKKFFLNLVFLFFLLGIFFFSPGAQGQIFLAEVEIEGMTCPFCNYGVEKVLDKVKGVKEVKVDLSKGIAILNARPNQSIQLEEIYPAIKKAGFTILSVKWSGQGKIQRSSKGEYYFKSKGEHHPIHVFNAAEMKKDLEISLSENKPVKVSAIIRSVGKEYICTQIVKMDIL